MVEVRRVMWCAVAAAALAAGLGAGIGIAGGEESVAADAVRLTAGLDARQEVPSPKGATADARGSFVATLERKGVTGTLTWRLTFRELSGNATAAHVHLAKRGRPGPVALGLCGPCRSGAHGSAKARAGTVQALLTGGAYVNVHTARNPAGEIRGQIRAGSTVPPPSTTTTTTTSTGGDDPYP
ncbi:MAG: CHRD domain-containing protein [Actinobacteria bacterium]|nr:CHRD domain-containing protein [Actinomycetota bacterium]MBA3565870.1 CHRD domain-containing protein [Actinomycetota bacterium]MDQ3425947.1 CHRD domain-containing protein [Actinomycetota bacterium]